MVFEECFKVVEAYAIYDRLICLRMRIVSLVIITVYSFS